ncbi:MAG: glycosyltransferase family 61 protein [Bacteroidota bacterium]
MHILTRIFNKVLHYINLFIGKIYDILQQKNIIGQFPFKIVSNFGNVIRIEHPYPANFNISDKDLFNEWKRYDTFSHDLYSVQNVRVTHEGIVLKKYFTFIKALPHPIFRNQFGVLYNLYTYIFYKKVNTKAKKYVLLYDHWSKNNYFHWTVDSLCRLYLFKHHLNFEYTLLLPENCPSYILNTLEKFDVENIEFIPLKSFLQIEDLYVMNYAAWSGQQHPDVIKKLRNHLMSQTIHDKMAIKMRIYVSRGKQKSRRIINEAEVITLLQKYKFSIVYFEELNFDQQISMMQQTEYLITSHGANMTNILFLPDHAKILELLNNEKPNFCFWSLASCLGLNYNYKLCGIEKSNHIHVDIKELERTLIPLLS